MKAKEYAAIYHQKVAEGLQDTDALARIALDMIREIEVIARTRRAYSNAAMVSVIDEVAQKWRAFSRLVQQDTVPLIDIINVCTPDFGAAYAEAKRRRHAA